MWPLIALVVLLTGCTNMGFPEMMDKLGKDPATACLKAVGGPYVVTLYRTNAQIANAATVNRRIVVECGDDKMKLEVEPNSSAPVGRP